MTNSTELSCLLRKTTVQSGLFYESHQAQWVNGKNTLEDLQQEPQGKLMPVLANLPIIKIKAVIYKSFVHPQSISLMRQQLNTLNSGHSSWCEEVRKGQSMEWVIFEQPNDERMIQNAYSTTTSNS